MPTELQVEAGSPVRTIPEVTLDKTDTAAAAEMLNFQTEMGRISRQSAIVFAGTIFTAVVGYVFKVYLARA